METVSHCVVRPAVLSEGTVCAFKSTKSSYVVSTLVKGSYRVPRLKNKRGSGCTTHLRLGRLSQGRSSKHPWASSLEAGRIDHHQSMGMAKQGANKQHAECGETNRKPNRRDVSVEASGGNYYAAETPSTPVQSLNGSAINSTLDADERSSGEASTSGHNSADSQQGRGVNGTGGVSQAAGSHGSDGYQSDGLLRGEGGTRSLVSALHATARQFQIEMELQEGLVRGPWFAQKWLGIDKNAWMKPLAYQGAVLALLRAAMEVADRGDGRDRDIHTSVLRSLGRQSAPLERTIQETLSQKDPGAEAWFFAQLQPPAVMAMLDILENEPRFANVASVTWQESGAGADLGPSTDQTLIDMCLHVVAAAVKLGPASLACAPFSEALQEETARLLSQLATLIPVREVHALAASAGLRREFLDCFGARAAAGAVSEEGRAADTGPGGERAFWVELVQGQLRAAFKREGVGAGWHVPPGSREVLEGDLAVFGFFAALGRSTRAFLAAKGVEPDEAAATLLRYLEGASVLFYPDLTNLPTYQLFVEIACEETAWLAFYPGGPTLGGRGAAQQHGGHGHGDKEKPRVSRRAREAALRAAHSACGCWLDDFISHRALVGANPEAKPALFLANSKKRWEEGAQAYSTGSSSASVEPAVEILGKQVVTEVSRSLERLLAGQSQQPADDELLFDEEPLPDAPGGGGGSGEALRGGRGGGGRTLSAREKLESELRHLQKMEQDLGALDLEMRAMEEVVNKLERLINSVPDGGGRERQAAARGEVEKLRRLQREVWSAEAALKAKAASKANRVRRRQQEEEEDRERRERRRGGSSSSSSAESAMPDGTSTGPEDPPHARFFSFVGDTAQAVAGAAVRTLPSLPRLPIPGKAPRPGPDGGSAGTSGPPFSRASLSDDFGPRERYPTSDYREGGPSLQEPSPSSSPSSSASASSFSLPWSFSSPSSSASSSSSSSTSSSGPSSAKQASSDPDDKQFKDEAAAAMSKASTSMVAADLEQFRALQRELDLLEASLGLRTSSSSGGGGGAPGVAPSEDASRRRGQLPESLREALSVPAGGAGEGPNAYDEESEEAREVLEQGLSAYRSMLHAAIEKLKGTSADAWRGTQLLSNDAKVAIGLLKRSADGQELTEREKKILKRTVTDLASFLPIAILMILPLTAVGHAAILAAIQKYVPGLIPSAYGADRLDVARRLEQVRDLKPEPTSVKEAAAMEDTLEAAVEAGHVVDDLAP